MSNFAQSALNKVASPPAARSYPEIGLLVAGQWVYDRARHSIVMDPANGEELGRAPVAARDDLDKALSAAAAGFAQWRRTPPDDRVVILNRAAALVEERTERLASLVTMEQGKPLADARGEVKRAVSIIRWDAAQSLRTVGRVNPAGPGWRQLVLRTPIGPVAAFTPWNAPIGSLARKISGALAAGCSLIVKPAEETPASACVFAQCFLDAGLPAEALSLVFGNPSEISSYLIDSPIIRLVTFTGSVAVGKHLAELAASHMKPAVMELGGHAPVIVCDDVDVATLAGQSARAKFRMAGQICTSPTRFLVQKRVFATFAEKFAEHAKAVRVGGGFEADVEMGPVANRRRLDALLALSEQAVASGAHLLAGGRRIGDRGFFYAPTVLSNVPAGAHVLTTEPFGPIATLAPFDDLDEAIKTANSLPLGLSAYAFTNSVERSARLMEEVECGILSLNHFGGPAPDMPFGGVKESGIGREGGTETLDSYTISRMVSHRTVTV